MPDDSLTATAGAFPVIARSAAADKLGDAELPDPKHDAGQLAGPGSFEHVTLFFALLVLLLLAASSSRCYIGSAGAAEIRPRIPLQLDDWNPVTERVRRASCRSTARW